MPDGRTRTVEPYHICLKGLETAELCRDEEDYDVMVKVLAVCAWRNNVIIITYSAVSNHTHTAALAVTWKDAQAFGEESKKVYSMYFQRKYGEEGILRRVKVKALWLDNPFHLRNTLAYIPRNAKDTGMRIEDYPWSGYRGMFVGGKSIDSVRMVSSLTRREKEAIFHTHANLDSVPWLLDRNDNLVPATCCDYEYLESAFNQDETFFLKMIGSVNAAEMEQKLILNLKNRQPDSAFFLTVSDIADRWFNKKPAELTLEQKTRLIPYIYRCYRTTVPQLARCLQEKPETIERIISKK